MHLVSVKIMRPVTREGGGDLSALSEPPPEKGKKSEFYSTEVR